MIAQGDSFISWHLLNTMKPGILSNQYNNSGSDVYQEIKLEPLIALCMKLVSTRKHFWRKVNQWARYKLYCNVKEHQFAE